MCRENEILVNDGVVLKPCGSQLGRLCCFEWYLLFNNGNDHEDNDGEDGGDKAKGHSAEKVEEQTPVKVMRSGSGV